MKLFPFLSALKIQNPLITITICILTTIVGCNEKENFDDLLKEAAAEINMDCPIMVDDETRLDSVIAKANRLFIYQYSLINMEANDVDTTDLKIFLVKGVLDNARYNPSMEEFRRNKVKMNYRYHDKDGIYLFEIRVKEEDYTIE